MDKLCLRYDKNEKNLRQDCLLTNGCDTSQGTTGETLWCIEFAMPCEPLTNDVNREENGGKKFTHFFQLLVCGELYCAEHKRKD